VEKTTNDGRPYYYNAEMKKTQWNKPKAHNKKTEETVENELPLGWVEKTTNDGRLYYYNAEMKKSQLAKPEGYREITEEKKEEKTTNDETKKTQWISVGNNIKGCLWFCYLTFKISLDILKKQFGQRSVYVVEKESTKEQFVMKMINIGQEGSEERKKAQKDIAAEINIGITLGRECPFLVRYLETFYHENFCCLIIEYCELGDLQQELDSKKQYDEPVFHSHIFFLFFLILFV
jgi:hypothetical protein